MLPALDFVETPLGFLSMATRRINEVVEEGRRLASNIRRVLKVELGIDNEELTRFGIQPFRGRKRAKKSSDAGAAGPETSDIPPK